MYVCLSVSIDLSAIFFLNSNMTNGFELNVTSGVHQKCNNRVAAQAPRLGACCHHPVSGIFSLAYISSVNGR